MGDTYHTERQAAAIIGKHRASGCRGVNLGAIDLEDCDLGSFWWARIIVVVGVVRKRAADSGNG